MLKCWNRFKAICYEITYLKVSGIVSLRNVLTYILLVLKVNLDKFSEFSPIFVKAEVYSNLENINIVVKNKNVKN